jgi:hypothetical protein
MADEPGVLFTVFLSSRILEAVPRSGCADAYKTLDGDAPDFANLSVHAHGGQRPAGNPAVITGNLRMSAAPPQRREGTEPADNNQLR